MSYPNSTKIEFAQPPVGDKRAVEKNVVIRDGEICEIELDEAGSGYLHAPQITFVDADGGSGALLKATLRQEWARFDTPDQPRKFAWHKLPNNLVVAQHEAGTVTITVQGGSDGNLVADALALKRVKDKDGKPLSSRCIYRTREGRGS